MAITPDNILYLPEGIDLRICPKNGFTSIKGFHQQVLRVVSPQNTMAQEQYQFKHVRGGPSSWRQLQVLKYGNQFDIPFRFDSVRFAIKRDPIERFKSAVEMLQLQAHSNYATPEDVPLINKDYDRYSSVKLLLDDLCGGKVLNQHFWTQTLYMGIPKDYDYVYDLENIEEFYKHVLSFYGIDYDRKVWYTHRNISNNSDPIHSEILFDEINLSKQRRQNISYMEHYEVYDKEDLITSHMTASDYARVKKLYKIDYDNGWY